MRAHPGDIIIAKSHQIGQPDQEAEVLTVRGEKGGPPFVVRWLSDGHEGLYFPGSDAIVRTRRRRKVSPRR